MRALGLLVGAGARDCCLQNASVLAVKTVRSLCLLAFPQVYLCVEECVGGLATVADGHQLISIREGARAQQQAGKLHISSNRRRQYQALQAARIADNIIDQGCNRGD